MRKAGSKRIGRAASRSDVARLAGVAPSTVSLVLNNTPGPRIPDETRKRVVAAAESLGYRSSSIAKALVTGRTNTIGVVLHFVGRPFIDYSARVLDGCWLGLAGKGYRLLMVGGSHDACVAGLHRERSVDGVIVLVPPHGAADQELLDMSSAGFPAVFIGSCPKRVACDYIDIDNVATARAATARLIAAGHRDIVHLAGPLEVNSAAVERLAGYRQAMAEAGLTVRPGMVIDCSFNGEFAEGRFGVALAAGLQCSAVFAANAGMARGAIRAAVAAGRSVPGDISVVTIDREQSATGGGPELSTHEQPLEEIGRRAALALVERIEGLEVPARTILLPCEACAGTTIAVRR